MHDFIPSLEDGTNDYSDSDEDLLEDVEEIVVHFQPQPTLPGSSLLLTLEVSDSDASNAATMTDHDSSATLSDSTQNDSAPEVVTNDAAELDAAAHAATSLTISLIHNAVIQNAITIYPTSDADDTSMSNIVASAEPTTNAAEDDTLDTIEDISQDTMQSSTHNYLGQNGLETSLETTMQDITEEPRGNWYCSDSEGEEEARATLEEVFEVDAAVEAKREQPPDIHVGAEVVAVRFHPTTQVVVAATLDAEVICYTYDTSTVTESGSSEHHDGPLRAITFSRDGCCLYTGSRDHSVAVMDADKWRVKRHYKDAHDCPVYSLCAITEHTFASGDDDGVIKIWDIRKEKAVFEFRCGEETVNSMIVDDTGKTLVVAVNDGSIAAFNTVKNKLIVQSEMYDSAMSCLAIVRNGTRLLVGTDAGRLQVFKWGEFGYHIDSVSEQPQKINCIEAVGDNRVVTGCEDGFIRAVNLYPHRYVGVVGRHRNFGVDALSVSCDQRFLATCCQDETLYFWDLQHLYNKTTNERKKGCKMTDLKNNLLSSRERNKDEFFSDMSKEIDSDDEYMGPVKRPRNVE